MSSMLHTSRSGALKARCPRLLLETALGSSVDAMKAAGLDGLIPVSIRWHAGVIESVEPVPDAEGLVLPRLVELRKKASSLRMIRRRTNRSR